MLSRSVKTLFAAFAGLLVLGASSLAFAQEAAAEAVQVAKMEIGGWIAIGAGLAIGLAALGGTMGQGKAAAAAMEGITRNPGSKPAVFVPMIICLALIESLVIFAWLIALLLQLKIGV